MIHATTTSKLDRENPWPGLESYEESAHDYFCGREYEAEKILDKVLDAPVTVLYGRSGLGKTSLLRAGLFPLLRERDFLPMYVRFELTSGAQPFTRQLQDAVRESIQVDLADAALPSEEESVWEYLHRADFELWSARNYPLTPVIVIDQFEELFTHGERFPDEVAAFRNDLGDLAENRIPADLSARIKTDEAMMGQFNLRSRNYKLLISLREDFLPHLDEWCRLIPALGRSRMRLLRLREDQAVEAVHEPAADLMTEELARRVVGIIAGADLHPERNPASAGVEPIAERRREAEVEPALLSLVCRELNEVRKRSGQAHFDRSLIEKHGRKTLSNYYSSCVHAMREQVKEFIEDELISEKGFRNFYALEDAVPSRLTDGELTELIDKRLLRLVEYHGAQRIELTHDVLTPAVRKHRDRRRVEKEKEREKAALEARAAELEAERQRHQADLQVAHEHASAMRKRSRVLAIVLAITVVVSVVAWVLGVWAFTAQRRAEENLRAATAHQLIAEAQGILSHDEPGGDEQAFQEILAANALLPPEEGLLYTAVAQRANTIKIINGHDGAVNSVAFSPDGAVLASAGEDHSVRLWRSDTGEQISESSNGHTSAGSGVAFSPDGRLVASAGWDKAIQLWNADSGQPVGDQLGGHTASVLAVAFSPDGRRLASAGWEGAVRMWDVATSQPIGMPLEGHSDAVMGVAFSPDGRLLASAGLDNSVRLWNADNGQPIGAPLEGHADSVLAVAFSPDGRRLASAGWEGAVRMWDVATSQPIGMPLEGHSGAVMDVAFSRDGLLASASLDNTIRLWDAETGRPIGTPFVGHADAVGDVIFSPDGDRLASASSDGTIRVWDVNTGVPLQGHKQPVFEVLFSPNGKRLASGSDDGVRLWDPLSGQSVGAPLLSHTAAINDIEFSGNNEVLATAGADGTVELWDPNTGQSIGQPLEGHTEAVRDMEFSPNSQLLATASADHTVRLWNTNSRSLVAPPLEGHSEDVKFVIFSRNGLRLASASDDGSVRLWDPATGRPIGEPLNHTAELMDVEFSPDGRFVATASSDGDVRLWNSDTGLLTGDHLKGSNYPVNDVVFSPDGSSIAVSGWDNIVRLWDTNTRRQSGEPLKHTNTVTDVEFKPDGRLLATASADHKIRMWDSRTGESVGAPLIGHTDEVTRVAFSPDGHQLASASADHSVRLWPSDASPEMLCDKLTVNMNDEQWRNWVSPDIDYDDYKPLCKGLPDASN